MKLDPISPDLRALATPIADLVFDPRNARRHPDRNLHAIVTSLERFGQRKPVVCNRKTKEIIAGNGLVTAAKSLGWDSVAVVWTDDDPTTQTAYAIADNRSAELASWDDAVLADLLREIEDSTDYALADVGFNLGEYGALLAKLERELEEVDDQGDEEEEPRELPTDPVSRPGEVYQLGPHRVICGDSRDPEAWAKLLDGARPALVVTSPPYASQRKYDETSGFQPIPPEGYADWYEPIQALVAQRLADDGSFVLNIKEHCEDGERHTYVTRLLLDHIDRWGWRWVDTFCWRDNRNGVPGGWNNRFKDAWEPCFHFTKQATIKFRPEAVSTATDHAFDYSSANAKAGSGSGLLGAEKASGYRSGLARPSNVIEAASETGSGGHTAPFPLALPDFFVRAFTDPTDVVLDPFLGSGTTLLAAAKAQRKGYGIEISPGYVDLIRARYGAFARANDLEPGDSL